MSDKLIFPCPDCGNETIITANWPRARDQATARHRLCGTCGKFTTIQTWGGGAETFAEWVEGDDEPEAEIEPLQFPTTAAEIEQDQRERLRAFFVWCKGEAARRNGGPRPAGLRSGGKGYGLDKGKAFYCD